MIDGSVNSESDGRSSEDSGYIRRGSGGKAAGVAAEVRRRHVCNRGIVIRILTNVVILRRHGTVDDELMEPVMCKSTIGAGKKYRTE